MNPETLLRAAVALHGSDVQLVELPDKFTTLPEVISSMRHALAREGHVALQEPLQTKPEDPLLCCLDLGSESPGIIDATKPKLSTLRLPLTDEATRGDLLELTADDAEIDAAAHMEPIMSTYEEAVADARKQQKKFSRKQERSAISQETRDAKTLAKREAKELERAARKAESKEERAERLRLAREEREAKRAKKEEELTSQREEEGEVDDKDDGPATDSKDDSGTGGDKHLPEQDTEEASLASTGEEEERARVHDTEHAIVPAVDAVLPPLLKVSTSSKTKYHANPTPIVRHIRAFSHVEMPRGRGLLDALLRGVPSDALKIVQGPPGTGKSKTIVDIVKGSPSNHRILVCAPSNVAAAGIYTRIADGAAELQNELSLCLPPARIPVGTPVHCNDPSRRIVCATISGRSGPILNGQSFDTILVDEAAQATEACTWTLVRRHVERIVLVGDTKQLPAVLADVEAVKYGYDRSLMQRLVESCQYPATLLSQQFRMHPEICFFPNTEFYNGSLTNAPTCMSHTLPNLPPYACITVRGHGENIGGSYRNVAEASKIAEDARALRASVKEQFSIVIIAGYQAQCRSILAQKPNVDVHTVDSYQGREADIVLLSVCRTGSSCGFFNDPRRLNVALTRARRAMRVYGSFDWPSDSILGSMANDARTRDVLK